ncbi:hypothetical protein [Butyrivibrio sp. MC2013]|uniref:hypothetical protein n=1 Tax=Butyrivibrio sp. MC2013 TaxID=1280686 RepID=UPI0003FF64E6|nr:hypothetical protein [Butyrivibrio sp. MC2013]
MAGINTDSQSFNNEVPFCNIYSQREKKELERLFLKQRISYYVDWQKQSIWQKLLGGKRGSDRINCLIRINRVDVERAYALVKDMPGLKFREISGDKEHRAVTKRTLMDQDQDYDEEDDY